jgi:hypothetical protein
MKHSATAPLLIRSGTLIVPDRFDQDGITICAPSHAGDGTVKLCQRICAREI